MIRKVATEAQATTQSYNHLRMDDSVDFLQMNQADQKTINDTTLIQAGGAPSQASSLEARVDAVVDAVAEEAEEQEHLNPDEIYERMGIKVELQGIIYSLYIFSEFVKVHSFGIQNPEDCNDGYLILEIVHPMIQKAYGANY